MEKETKRDFDSLIKEDFNYRGITKGSLETWIISRFVKQLELKKKQLDAHATFVADVLDGDEPEIAWDKLTKTLDKLSDLVDKS